MIRFLGTGTCVGPCPSCALAVRTERDRGSRGDRDHLDPVTELDLARSAGSSCAVLREKLMKHNRLQIRGGLCAAPPLQTMNLKTWGGAGIPETREGLRPAREERGSSSTNQRQGSGNGGQTASPPKTYPGPAGSTGDSTKLYRIG